MTTPIGAAPSALTAQNSKLKSAAADFEAFFVAQMLKQVREAANSDGDTAGATMIEFAEEHLARAIASGGSLGLGRLLMDSVQKASHATEALSASRLQR
jgi:Rod binding domain-containing protein